MTSNLTRLSGKKGDGPDRTAIIGIPVQFSEEQVRLTLQACKDAGFSSVEPLDEPVAAALDEGLSNFTADRQEKVMIIDFGGGTLDVTLLDIEGRTIKVVARDGDPNLGGEDVDFAISNHS